MRHSGKICPIVVFFAVCTILFAALNAGAQGQPQNQNQTQPQNQNRLQNQIQNQSGDSLLGENILGMQVKTKAGKDVGDIQDVLFNRSGRVQDFIVDTAGGFFGMGGKTIAISRSDLNYDTEKGYAVYQGTEADIKNMPNISYEPYAYGYYRYPHRQYWGRPYWGGYYGRPYWGGGYYGYPGRGYYGYGQFEQYPRQGQQYRQGQQGQQSPQGQQAPQQSQQSGTQTGRGYRGYNERPPEVSMRDIIGAEVLTEGNNTVGDIKNLIVNNKGQITAAIIDVGGFLGIGSKEVAVPFNQIQYVGPYYVMYPGTEQQLKNMPTFNPGQFQQNRQG